MTLLETPTLAQTTARQHFAANLEALRATQPDLLPWVTGQSLRVEWVFARDRTLTALDESGQWASGCSLPQRAAQAMLTRLEIKGAVACFLAPAHGAQLRAALEKLRPEQAVVAIIPEMRDLTLILHCEDFSSFIAGHRLWLAAGPAWEVGLRKVFDDHLGLATPSQFIRIQDFDPSRIEQMIAAAQRVFSDVGTDRNNAMQRMRREPPAGATGRQRICIVAPSRFRLWNDIGLTMVHAFDGQSEIESLRYDSDDPASSSPLALLTAARQCTSIMTANTSRSDLPGLLPEMIPWITWVTTGRIPSSALSAVDDHLIVVTPALHSAAVKAGWHESRVHIGTWPAIAPRRSAPPSRPQLSIIADTSSLDTPKDLNEYSSHRLLWESIRHELQENPFILTDANAFLGERVRKAQIADDVFSCTRFIDKLIVPAYQQGLARTLIAARLPLRLFGRGWDGIDEFKSFAAGPVQSRQEFADALDQSSAIVRGWPEGMMHPVDVVALPIVRRTGQRPETFIREAQSALAGRIAPSPSALTPLSLELVRRILR